jgi:hypothetical protein
VNPQDVNVNFYGEVYYILYDFFLAPNPGCPPSPTRPGSTSGTVTVTNSERSDRTEFKITIATFSAAVIVLIAVAIVPAVGFLYSVKLCKKTTVTPDSHEEQVLSTLVVKLEEVSTAAEEVKREEVDQCKVDDSSLTKDKLDHKIDLPDFISSRDTEQKIPPIHQ